MSRPWTEARVVPPALARTLITSQFPDLAPARVELLGVGWDNTAYLVDRSWVFRFPRRSIAVDLLETEARLLPLIARFRAVHAAVAVLSYGHDIGDVDLVDEARTALDHIVGIGDRSRRSQLPRS